MDQNIGIIGTGRVGTAIGYALYKKGYSVIANDRNPRKIRAFYKLLENLSSNSKKPLIIADKKTRKIISSRGHPWQMFCKVGFPDYRTIAEKSQIIFITTQDSEIIKVYNQIRPYLRKGQIIIHCSGVLSNTIFQNARKKGIIIIGLHPIQTFPTIKQAIGATKNIYYGIETKGKGKVIAQRIVKDLEGKSVYIQGKDKPLYHIMCVFASNYLVALISAVFDIAQAMKIKPAQAFKMLEPLIYQTLKNIKQSGIKKSLSGPIERGDIATIKAHLTVLKKRMSNLLPVYSILGQKTLDLVKIKNKLNRKTIVTLKKIIK